MEIKFEKLKLSEIENCLTSSISDFESFRNRCFLHEYAIKLFKYADFIVGRSSHNEIGCIIAFYANKKPNVFITHVHTFNNYKRKGYCTKMFEMLINRHRAKGFSNISLEVRIDNNNAISAYSKFGFVVKATNGNKYLMNLNL